MKQQTIHHRSVKRRVLAAGLLVSLALISGALAFASGPAMAEGGGTPIGDQGVQNTPERRAEMARQDLANNGPGYGRSQSDRGSRGNQNYRGSVDPNYRGSRNYRDQRYSRSYQPYYRSYSYVDPYYSDPHPSPGISLFFGF